MGLGDNIGFLIDLTCMKKKNPVFGVDSKTIEKLIEALF